MPASDEQPDKVYFSLILPPEKASESDLFDLVAESLGMDRYQVRLRLRKPPPCVIGLVDRHVAYEATQAVVRAGGDAFAPSLDDIQSLGPTLKIRDLRITAEGLALDLWRGPSTTINAADVQIIVRARMSEAVKRSSYAPKYSPLLASSTNPTSPISIGWGVGGAYGLAAGIHAAVMYGSGESGWSQSSADTDLHQSHKLDVHHADGRVFQIDGDKFGYEILGELKGHSDNVNIDRMCELMTHFNPEAVVDPYFAYFSPPVGYKRMRIPHMTVNKDDPAFAFYSRWAALMYRHVMGTGKG
jgi:hypothetical protein